MDAVLQTRVHNNYSDMDHMTTVFYQGKDILLSIGSNSIMKSIFSGFSILAAVLFGPENYEMLVFLGLLIVIDLITGMIAAVSRGEPIESRKAFKTATKSFVYLLFFSAAFLTHQIVPYSDFIKTGVLSFLAITELLSVMENMAKMGYSLPAKLLNQLRDKAGGIAGPGESEPVVFGNGDKK